MRRGLIQCNFPIQRLDAIKGKKDVEKEKEKRGRACTSRWIKDAPLSHVPEPGAVSWGIEITRQTDISHLDFSGRFCVTRKACARLCAIQNSQFSIHIRFANNANGHIRRICTCRLIFVSIRWRFF